MWQLCLHSDTQPYTTWPRWREQGGGLHSLPLGVTVGFGDSGADLLCVHNRPIFGRILSVEYASIFRNKSDILAKTVLTQGGNLLK